jgi:3-isopropylmalate/(R)-2-methylmalate dehydratase small subunit
VQVSPEFLQVLFKESAKDKNTEVEVNLVTQTVTIPSVGLSEGFEINSYKKTCMINGYDDIDYLLSMKDKIEGYEKSSKYLDIIA